MGIITLISSQRQPKMDSEAIRSLRSSRRKLAERYFWPKKKSLPTPGEILGKSYAYRPPKSIH